MADGYLKHFLSEKSLDFKFEVHSAGIETHGLNPKAVSVMEEDNIDISLNSSDNIDKYKDYDFNYVITVCDNAAENCPVFPGDTIRIHWSFDDPAKATGTNDEIMYEFRRVRDEIKSTIRKWIDCL
jgi:arsenate reductase